MTITSLPVQTSPLIARTGRVQNWMENPDGRLPVSCTVFVVEDSMEGPNGIEASWRYVTRSSVRSRSGSICPSSALGGMTTEMG